MTFSKIQGLLPSTQVGGAVAILGAAVGSLALYRLIFSRSVVDDGFAKSILGKLFIKDWSLPGISYQTAPSRDPYAPQPVFDRLTTSRIQGIKEMIEKARTTPGAALPNLVIQGDTGVGKTMLIESLCRDSGIGFIRIPSGAMENHLAKGTHVSALNEVLSMASKSSGPVYIIMDDGEELVAQRPSENHKSADDPSFAYWLNLKKVSETNAQRRIALVNAILEASGAERRQIGFVITTNRPKVIDSAFKTRAHIVDIPNPDEERRKFIIITHLPTIFNKDNNFLSFFDKRVLTDMARKTEGFSGRDIVQMLENLYACVSIESGNITDDLIDGVILTMKRSIATSQCTKSLMDRSLKVMIGKISAWISPLLAS